MTILTACLHMFCKNLPGVEEAYSPSTEANVWEISRDNLRMIGKVETDNGDMEVWLAYRGTSNEIEVRLWRGIE